ncbi:carrier protein [Rhizoctonia solani AG-1 IA]|uniref:Carrier protein n=1 Tax=Thanatephorus cucumeris (strain AG1-IA) TaxID=983506 RepID=L8WLK6_THACA|nr:carrier protein [Rhizoctonia solani AG-1 IA]
MTLHAALSAPIANSDWLKLSGVRIHVVATHHKEYLVANERIHPRSKSYRANRHFTNGHTITNSRWRLAYVIGANVEGKQSLSRADHCDRPVSVIRLYSLFFTCTSTSLHSPCITMAPINSSGKHKESGTARVLGSGASGVAELLVFHPVDTIAKRLMSNKAKVSFSALSPIIFREYSNAPLLKKAVSLFPGLGYAAGYKVAQRIYKFGGQPYFNDLISSHYKQNFTNAFGEKNGKMLMHACAGSLTGIGEVVLLPLDVLKIKRQVNPEAFRGRGVFKIVSDEGFALYRGWGWTMARNAPGSFAVSFS